ncbi:hypothetical protein PSAL_015590 [Pseudooceanicola algae]|uniref:Uncharacterized protein n=1 Tax=Pseudooceanicola algae TaxID=1537215 RepID=A0A418SGZ0_9RHOB|nr:hypothetical protein PSAL_015590 [Pseudooceanicola algae]
MSGTKRDSPGSQREIRLKAALKANLGRRKAQARARAETESEPEAAFAPETETDQTSEHTGEEDNEDRE